MIIFDPESALQLPFEIVGKVLKLSPAEALLACEIFRGITLREAAERLGISINTCKSQLKSIYAKVGCRSHVDLAKTLVMTGITQNL